jgi:PhnB protein
MTVLCNPYLNFDGKAREALTFYQGVFGGELEINTFGETPSAMHPGLTPDNVMHGMLRGDKNVVLMAADANPEMNLPPSTTAISLSGEDDATLRGYFEALSDGASDLLPLNQAPWGDTFGMLTDKFGIPWMVNILGPQHGADASAEAAGITEQG